MLGIILLVVLVMLLIGAVPAWPHSREWGYVPSGGVGLILIVVLTAGCATEQLARNDCDWAQPIRPS